MNDPIADCIPFFRQDYDALKRDRLWARENVLFASYCSGINSFGCVIITTDRLIHVLFAAEKGFFAPPREKCKSKNWQNAFFYNVPASSLTPKELAGKYVEEIPLTNILSVQRGEMKERLNGRPLIAVSLSLLTGKPSYVERRPLNAPSIFEQDYYYIYFFDLQDARKVHDMLGAIATRRHVSVNPSPSGKDIPLLLEALAKLRANGTITDQEYDSKKKELLSRM